LEAFVLNIQGKARNRVTDRCFSDVLAHMPLKIFALTDDSDDENYENSDTFEVRIVYVTQTTMQKLFASLMMTNDLTLFYS